MAIALVACGSDDSDDAATGDDGAPSGEAAAATIVVTTSILGDITEEVVGDNASIETVMPIGADPHEFSASARQAEEMAQADLLVVNGAGFEAGLEGIIDQAEDSGVPVFAFADHVELLAFDDDDHGHDDAEGHEDEADHDDDHGHDDAEGHDDEADHDEADHDDEMGADGDEHGHDHGDEDPHLWTDPGRIADAVEDLSDAVAGVEGVDVEDVQQRAAAYVDELETLDQEIESLLAGVPEQRRVLVTNHEVFNYFAERYDFEVVGTVIPSITTLAEPAPRELEAVAHEIEEHDVPAIFAETTQSTALAEALASSVGDVEVIELYTESLGEEGSGAETYIGMMRTNAELIANALG